MVIIESFTTAVVLLIITMLCWGSWANTQKLASKSWPFQLFYWDYVIGILLCSLVLGLTMGSMGEDGRPFVDDLLQADFSSFVSAFIGGVIFNIANILLVAAIDIAGMAVAFPIGIGLALVIGVIVNYIKYPVGDPLFLFAGVFMVVVAILMDAKAYKNISKGDSKISRKGIVLSLSAGVLMGFFFRFVADSMVTDNLSPERGKFTAYGAFFVFALGIYISNFLWNSYVMAKPFSGKPVKYKEYFLNGNLKLHSIGWLGGIIWAIGMSFSLIASEQAGFAISYGLGQGATMVAAIWGVFVWKEFKNADGKTQRMINWMFVFFIVGLVAIIYARLK
ncbi:GRP family sugar transporter [Lutimonas zeaxanthinifaciens]|uniref:GRP family sugar transporter n=1 Tax=Lutimonas zeaxanthinifaciens TaxID=3060215 RepID=UPI00265CF204|nr:GRP family sugar transporter [Lutimonas sp. YSD2104]WKK65113.1 GRP family sugar transporter [Lutimonas sp. YSD2104]